MCLEIIDSVYKTRKLKKSLPNWFPVWKIIQADSTPQFGGNPLSKGEIHTAVRERGWERSEISYRPGFHAFLDLKEARGALKYLPVSWRKGKILCKFWALPKWITKSGSSNDDYNQARTVVLKKIRRK